MLLFPAHHPGADRRAHGAAGQAEAHPVPRARAGPRTTSSAMRMFPGVRRQGRRVLHARLRVIAALAGLFQINPIWLFGPYKASVVSPASQPDWYVMLPRRLDPALAGLGDPRLLGYTIPPMFWAAVVLPGVIVHLGRALSVHRSQVHQGQRRITTCCSGPGTCRCARRSAPWRSRSTLVLLDLRRQRHHRRASSTSASTR